MLIRYSPEQLAAMAARDAEAQLASVLLLALEKGRSIYIKPIIELIGVIADRRADEAIRRWDERIGNALKANAELIKEGLSAKRPIDD